MATYLDRVFGEAAAAMRRTQELAAGGAVAFQMRRAQELHGALIKQASAIGPGLLESYGRQVRGTVDALGGASAVQRSLTGLATAFGQARPTATSRTFSVAVEEQEPEAPQQPRPSEPGPDKEGMRQFITEQMQQAKDDEAKAACSGYVLRNRLLC